VFAGSNFADFNFYNYLSILNILQVAPSVAGSGATTCNPFWGIKECPGAFLTRSVAVFVLKLRENLP
jgi:hypothetical protein